MIIKVRENTTVLELISDLHKGISKQKAKKIIKNSTFMCDGEPIKSIPTTILEKGKELEILKNTVTNLKHEHPEKHRPIVIKYEDDYMIVAIKPVGMLSCKNLTQKGDSFDKMLEEYISKRDQVKTFLWIAHRIDREVEGLIIFAKTEKLQHLIKDNWNSVTKKYLALTQNIPKPKSGTIESFLKDGYKHVVKVYKNEVEGSKFAKTEYEYQKKIGKYHLLEITLHTGRKNQIRAHLSSIGCSIVGDFTYGADSKVVRQIRLVAYYLEFTHPVLNKVFKLKYDPKASFFKPKENEDEKYKRV